MRKVKYSEITVAKEILKNKIKSLEREYGRNYSIINLMREALPYQNSEIKHAILIVLSMSKCVDGVGFIMPTTTNCCGKYWQKEYKLTNQMSGYWNPDTGCEIEGAGKVFFISPKGNIKKELYYPAKEIKLPDSWAI